MLLGEICLRKKNERPSHRKKGGKNGQEARGIALKNTGFRENRKKQQDLEEEGEKDHEAGGMELTVLQNKRCKARGGGSRKEKKNECRWLVESSKERSKSRVNRRDTYGGTRVQRQGQDV